MYISRRKHSEVPHTSRMQAVFTQENVITPYKKSVSRSCCHSTFSTIAWALLESKEVDVTVYAHATPTQNWTENIYFYHPRNRLTDSSSSQFHSKHSPHPRQTLANLHLHSWFCIIVDFLQTHMVLFGVELLLLNKDLKICPRYISIHLFYCWVLFHYMNMSLSYWWTLGIFPGCSFFYD